MSSDQLFGLSIVRGEVPGISSVNKFGLNTNIGTSGLEDIWDAGGTYVFPAWGNADIVKIRSSVDTDVEQIEIHGLNVKGTAVICRPTLQGTALVTLGTALWRCNLMTNIGTANIAGNVQLVSAGGGTAYAQITAGHNHSLSAIYTIPAGKKGYLTNFEASLDGLTLDYTVSGRLQARSFGGVFKTMHTFSVDAVGGQEIRKYWNRPDEFDAKTDIKVMAASSSDDGELHATFDLILVDN